jgi:hypothetical protein
MSAKRPDLAARAATGLAGAAAAFAARKALQSGWKLITGRPPPDSPEDAEVSIGEAVAWALVLGAVVGAARLIAVRYAAAQIRARSGAAGASP